MLDNESQNPEREMSMRGQTVENNGSQYSREYSQNVEINSNRSSEIKYLFGEKMGLAEEGSRDDSTLKQKETSVQNRFMKLYNRQGHYSATQSIERVFGRCMC